MAHYTSLSVAQIADVLGAMACRPRSARSGAEGERQHRYHVWSGGRRWFLRVNEGKTPEDVAFEAEVLRFLAREGFPVAPLVLAEDGTAQIEVAGRPAMLFAYAPGEELERADVTALHCQRIGAELGRLHALAPRFGPARPNPYRWGGSRLGGRARAGRGRRSAGRLRHAAPARGARGLAGAAPRRRRASCTATCSSTTSIWAGDGVSALLDWEMSCVDAFAYDLAVMVNAWCYGAAPDPPDPREGALRRVPVPRRKLEPETAFGSMPGRATRR